MNALEIQINYLKATLQHQRSAILCGSTVSILQGAKLPKMPKASTPLVTMEGRSFCLTSQHFSGWHGGRSTCGGTRVQTKKWNLHLWQDGQKLAVFRGMAQDYAQNFGFRFLLKAWDGGAS